MNTLSPSLQRTSAWARGLAAVSLVAGAWALSTAASQAQARDVYWSVGVNSPGVSIGASNAPVVVHQPPAYYYAPPVVVQPAPVYYHRPPAVVYGPPVVYAPPRPVVIGAGPCGLLAALALIGFAPSIWKRSERLPAWRIG